MANQVGDAARDSEEISRKLKLKILDPGKKRAGLEKEGGVSAFEFRLQVPLTALRNCSTAVG